MLINKDILWLKVSVIDSLAVNIVQPTDKLAEIQSCDFFGKGTSRNKIVDDSSLSKLKYNIGLKYCFIFKSDLFSWGGMINSDDILVLQLLNVEYLSSHIFKIVEDFQGID